MLDHRGGLELDLKVVQSLALGPRTLETNHLGTAIGLEKQLPLQC